jgi:hypothetical protein
VLRSAAQNHIHSGQNREDRGWRGAELLHRLGPARHRDLARARLSL